MVARYLCRQREADRGHHGEALARLIGETGKSGAIYAESFADAVAAVARPRNPGDMILTLGAGQRVATWADDSGKTASP